MTEGSLSSKQDRFECEGCHQNGLRFIANLDRQYPPRTSRKNIFGELRKRGRGLHFDRFQVGKLKPYVILDEMVIVPGVEKIQSHERRTARARTRSKRGQSLTPIWLESGL